MSGQSGAVQDLLRICFVQSNSPAGDLVVRRGFYRYVRLRMPWEITHFLQDQEAFEHMLDLRPHGGCGVVGRPDLAERARLLKVPFVNLYGGKPVFDLPQIGTDDEAIGRMAAEYLQSLHFENYAFLGLSAPGFSAGRWEGFWGYLKDQDVSVYRFPDVRPVEDGTYEGSGWLMTTELPPWLLALPKPCAVFACTDIWAFWVSEACRKAELDVPEDIAVVGVDNDPNYCELGHRPLSSIAVPHEKLGYEAAAMLARLLDGTETRNAIYLKPEGVVSRASTDILWLRDSRLAKAVRFINDQAHTGIRVDDVCRVAGMSRRALELHFQKAVGCTPFASIRQRQLEHAKSYLRETILKVEAIAPMCGFSSSARLSTEFKKHVGIPPMEYRRQFRV